MKKNNIDILAYCRSTLRWAQAHKDQISDLEMMDLLSHIQRLLAIAG